MSCRLDFASLAAPHIRPLRAYDPGYEPSEIRRDLKLSQLAELGSNESAFGPSADVLTFFRNAPWEVLHRYPDAGGRLLKRALARHYSTTPAHFTLGNGSHELLVLMALTFAAPGDEIVYSQYGFAVYPLAAQACGARGIAVPADSNLSADPDAMLAAISERTKLVYLANPNNPTGSHWDAATLERFLEAMPPHVLLVLDEAYFEFADPDQVPDGCQLLARFPNLIVARTFSKGYGLAGLRVGFLLADPGIHEVLERTRLSFNVNQLGMRAAAIALGDQAHIQQAKLGNARERAWLSDELQGIGLKTYPSQGNFVLVDFARDATPIEQALVTLGVLVRPMRGYGLAHCLRITVGTRDENEMLLFALKQLPSLCSSAAPA